MKEIRKYQRDLGKTKLRLLKSHAYERYIRTRVQGARILSPSRPLSSSLTFDNTILKYRFHSGADSKSLCEPK